MSVFDLRASIESAERRFGEDRGPRRRRNDHGRFRMGRASAEVLGELLSGLERPAMDELLSSLAAKCKRRRARVPSRATVYAYMARGPGHLYPIAELPAEVRAALYNLSSESAIPGHQLAFYCLNYGGTKALSFAAGLPWLDLYQAARMRGWRAKSRGVLEAIRAVRRI